MKIALLGYGKMGKTIEKLAIEKGHKVTLKATSTPTPEDLKNTDVAIEFSTPEAAVANITACFTAGVPVVCGTTGWLKHYDDVLKKREKRNGSLIYASNFSVGVNLFFALNKQLAMMMEKHRDYSVAMEEIHHTQKLDAPSGTAITLAEDIVENSRYTKWALDGNEKNTIPIVAKRQGDVKGTHSISWHSKVDSISIRHEAHSRDGFALGAILAAEWLQNKTGVFTMQDVLGLED